MDEINNWDEFQEFKPAVKNYLRKIINGMPEPEFTEVFDEAYYRAFPKYEKTYDPKGKSSAKSWLTMITEQQFYDVNEKHKNVSGERLEDDNEIEFEDNANEEETEIGENVTKEMSINSKHILNPIDARRRAWSKKGSIEKLKDISGSYIDTQLLNSRLEVFNFNDVSDSKLGTWIRKDERKWMLKALKLTYKSSKKLSEIDNEKLDKSKEAYPVLAAIAVNSGSQYVKEAFKGESDNFEEHCEYVLFEKKNLSKNYEKIEDGTLYLTLEPCIKRSPEKTPCAVRIARSPVKTVYIGIIDANEEIKERGVEIIKTGIYTFDEKELASSKNLSSLKNSFDKKRRKTNEKVTVRLDSNNFSKEEKYSVIEKNDEYIKYAIGNAKEVRPFHRDIQFELLKLNKKFIEAQEGRSLTRYTNPDLPDFDFE